MKYKKILLATDGSDVSNHALEEAIQLVIDTKAFLRILYVVDEAFIFHGGSGFDYSPIIKEFREAGQKILAKASKLVSKHKSVKFDTKLIELNPFQGRIAEMIVYEALDWSADLLIIGTHGRRGFSKILLGSVAEQVIRSAAVPVLLIPKKSTKEDKK